MRDQVFIKQFEDDYNLSRELALLADLSQRAAPVPKVISSDYQNLTLSMENRGKSLVEWLPMLSDQEVLVALSKSVDAFSSIGTLGVCHIDIAARNILFETRWVSKAQVIDFNAALCQRFPLQKPIWILPTEVSHHPLLAEAIAEDWTRFFDLSGLPRPSSFSHPFDIPWDHYRRYWPERLKSNELAGAMDRILAFGIGGLLEEVAQSRTDPLRSRLKAQTRALRCCTSEKQARAELQQLVESLSPDQATPVPKFRGKPRSSSPSSREEGDSPTVWTPPIWTVKFCSTLLLVTSLWLTDRVYVTGGARLGDEAFYAALLAVPVMVFLCGSIMISAARIWLVIGFGLLIALQVIFAMDLVSQTGLGLSLVPVAPTLFGFWAAMTFRPRRVGALRG